MKAIEKMENDELIDKFEEIGIDYAILMKESLKRYVNKMLTDIQEQRLEDIQTKRNCDIFDCLGVDKRYVEAIIRSCLFEQSQ